MEAISMEGISHREAAELLEVARNAPRWLLRDGKRTELGFKLERRGATGMMMRVCTADERPDGACEIPAGVFDTVMYKGALRKVVAVERADGALSWTLEWLQHWQVPVPCDADLGWSDEYRRIASALEEPSSAGAAAEYEAKKLEETDVRTWWSVTAVLPRGTGDITRDDVAKSCVTFNDVRELVVLPLARRSSTHLDGGSSLAYLSLLGDAEKGASIAPEIDTSAQIPDGKGRRSRRACVFFRGASGSASATSSPPLVRSSKRTSRSRVRARASTAGCRPSPWTRCRRWATSQKRSGRAGSRC
jgi:hypothetical protein